MRRYALIVLAALAAPVLLLASQAQGGKPPAQQHPGNPPPSLPKLGELIFNDTRLSNPPGVSCATCHPAGKGYANDHIMPGAVKGRFGNRRPPSIAYSKFSPAGPPAFNEDLGYVGGLFWDGRATGLADQVAGQFSFPPAVARTYPVWNPNEMNNLTIHGIPDPDLVVEKVRTGPYALLFHQLFGQITFPDIVQALVAYEQSDEVSPFSSKYDAWLVGRAHLTPSELNGLRLVTGSLTGRPGGPAYKDARCAACHGIPSTQGDGPDLWTQFCYPNIGVPRNEHNPFYKETNSHTNPFGFNALGAGYVDLGLGDYLYPLQNLPPGNMGPGSNGQGDFLGINGAFKVPTLRNVAKHDGYMHNAVFTDLKTVVHFYNKRNLTTCPGEVIDFTRAHPYAGLRGRPLFATPEYPAPSSLLNPSGLPPAADDEAQVGNLGLTDKEENDIVNFLHTLSDGFFKP